MQSIAGVLSRLLQELGLDAEIAGWRAVTEWPEVVGPRIAQRTRAVSFRDGTLRVEVEGSAWLHELGFLKRDLLRQLGQRLGPECVRDLQFIIARGGIQR